MRTSHREILRELIEQEGQRLRPPHEFAINGKLWGFKLPTLYRRPMVQKRLIYDMLGKGLLMWAKNNQDLIASGHGILLFTQGGLRVRGGAST